MSGRSYGTVFSQQNFGGAQALYCTARPGQMQNHGRILCLGDPKARPVSRASDRRGAVLLAK